MSTDPKDIIGPTDAELESLEPLGELSEAGEAAAASETVEAVEPAAEQAEKTESVEPEPKKARKYDQKKKEKEPKPRGAGFVGFLKQNMDIYTVMLGIGVIALAIGVYCLAVEMSRYDWDVKAKGHRASISLRAYDSLAANLPDGLPLSDCQAQT
jgi:uncharacterized membrane protein